MTKPINEMTPLEIREAVAVEIMGEPARLYTPYESYIGCAFDVVEKMRVRGWTMSVGTGRTEGRWQAEFHDENYRNPKLQSSCGFGDTPAMAICKAALDAVRETK